jgi:hypothetical protein
MFTTSERMHPSGLPENRTFNKFVKMTQWLQVDVPEKLSAFVDELYLMPGQKGRRYVRVVMSATNFRQYILDILELSSDWPINDLALCLPSKAKIDSKAKKHFKERFFELLNVPRHSINFIEIGNRLVFEYESDSGLSELSGEYCKTWMESGE